MMNEEDYVVQGPIYKYTSTEAAVATVKNTTLKFTCPLEFNDPFDCNTSILEFTRTPDAVAEYKQALEQAGLPLIRKMAMLGEFYRPDRFQEIYGSVARSKILRSKVTCFSKNYKSTLMWSHYADHHKGVCLEFNGSMEPEEILLRRVAMIANVNYDRTETINYNLDKQAATLDLFTRKWEEWRYEEEVRIIIVEEDPYHKFSKSFLTGVVFGCRTPQGDKQRVLEALAASGYQVPLQQAMRAKFKLEFQPIML